MALFHQNYGRLTVCTLTPSISLQDLGLNAEARVQEATTCLGSAEAVTGEGLG